MLFDFRQIDAACRVEGDKTFFDRLFQYGVNEPVIFSDGLAAERRRFLCDKICLFELDAESVTDRLCCVSADGRASDSRSDCAFTETALTGDLSL